MSLEEHFNSLLQYSKSIALTEFQNGTSDVTLDLLSRERKLIRDAEPHEVKLAAFCAGDPNTKRQLQERTDVNGISGTKREDVERILRAANTLNQMCNFPGMKEKIEELAHIHEDRQTNLDYLYEAYRKNDAELDQLSNEEPIYMDLDETEQKIREEEAAIQRYERELQQRKTQSKMIQKRKMEHSNIKDDLIKLQEKAQSNVIKTAEDAELDALEKEILLLKQSIIEQDTNMDLIQVEIESKARLLSSNNNTSTSTSIKELNTGLKARIDKLFNSNDQSTKPMIEEFNELIKSFQSTENALQSFLTYLQNVHTKEEHESTIRTIYARLLDFILHHNNESASTVNLDQLFPGSSDIPKDTSFFKISNETNVCTSILMKLYNQKEEMTLESLTIFAQDYAKKIGFEEKDAVKSIFKLVGQDLITIDRTRNDYSTVKLQL